jgi:hypothetical protein
MQFINLTPHAINIFAAKGDATPAMVVPPSGIAARAATKKEHVDTFDGIPIFRVDYGDLEGMPMDWEWPKEETVLITSALAKPALDLWLEDQRPSNEEGEPLALVWTASPGELVRDKDGQPIGCIGLNF